MRIRCYGYITFEIWNKYELVSKEERGRERETDEVGEERRDTFTQPDQHRHIHLAPSHIPEGKHTQAHTHPHTHTHTHTHTHIYIYIYIYSRCHGS